MIWWIPEFYQKYRFQLWLVGIISVEQLNDLVHDKNNKIEQVIAADPEYAYLYAKNIIKSPWPPGEKAIASNSQVAYLYAIYVIKEPWPMGEKAIASDSQVAYLYATRIIKSPWPPGEKAIASKPYWKQEYESLFKVKLCTG